MTSPFSARRSQPIMATLAPPGPSSPTSTAHGILRALGPGLVTGAADDDPSGIATYSQVGAQFGYGIGWTMLFSLPLMFVVQALCARIGAVTGQGIAENLKRHYPRPALTVAVLLLLTANVINLGADLGAMGAALKLLIGGPLLAYTFGFGVLSAALTIFIPYARYAVVLKWLTLSLFAYVGVLFATHVNWPTMLRSLVLPSLHLDRDRAMALVAVLGTTISPYLFFWQADQEVEEGRRRNLRPLRLDPRRAEGELARIRTDTGVGMGFSNLIALCIITATAATLNAHGVTNIETSAQAAEALRPIAGRFAFLLFALGILGTGLLAVPVLAGSAAYAVAETCGWPCSLERKPREAKAFYGLIAAATLGGVALNLIGLDPIKALYWSAVVNGALAAPLMALIMLIVTNRRAMGKLTAPRGLVLIGWVATAIMAAVTAMFLAW